jgi:hypothetical protein
MLTGNTFHINFDYALSENIIIKLKAAITCDYMLPCYVVTDLQVINNAIASNFPNEIKIKPVLQDDHIEWLHTDSLRGSLLSTAIGKAIEATGHIEMLCRREVAA